MTMKSGTTKGLVLVGRRCGYDTYEWAVAMSCHTDGRPFGRPEEKSVIGNSKQVIIIG